MADAKPGTTAASIAGAGVAAALYYFFWNDRPPSAPPVQPEGFYAADVATCRVATDNGVYIKPDGTIDDPGRTGTWRVSGKRILIHYTHDDEGAPVDVRVEGRFLRRDGQRTRLILEYPVPETWLKCTEEDGRIARQ